MLGQFCGQHHHERVAVIHSAAQQLEGSKPRLVMVGSSSFRLWPQTDTVFSHFDVVNAGFGGSCFGDLWALRDTLIYALHPEVLLVYEGDNDLQDGMETSDILRVADMLLEDICQRMPETRVVLIAPKHSPARSSLSDRYLKLNEGLALICESRGVVWVNFWGLMHEGDRLREEWFIHDLLHLNNEGYAAWVHELRKQVPWLDPHSSQTTTN